MKRVKLSTLLGILTLLSVNIAGSQEAQLGPRPFFLVDQMEDSDLKRKLNACKSGPFTKSNWSIGHRGAPLQFPEHTHESYIASARMGAGIIECDVTFTKDKQLVCRHSQNDLHTTTNILQSTLAKTCKKPFSPGGADQPAKAECRVSDITLAEFKTLSGKMDGSNKGATSLSEFMNSTPKWRTDLYKGSGKLITHAESIELIKSLGAKFTPELKAPVVQMPFNGFSQSDYAQALINEYKEAGVAPSDVYPQSFNLEDIKYWIEHEPEFGKQAIYLESQFTSDSWSANDSSTWQHTMAELKLLGLNYIAPPLWVLVTLRDGRILPSEYATQAKQAGLKIITWTIERSGSLTDGGGWYYQSVANKIDREGDVFELLHVLHKDVGVVGVFSDWPATTTFYANCFGLK